ncbi:MAG TPA: DUF2723 domain-containing protein [Sedimentisphaerales bacterium]|nr:DUF2723 domain-containing protein [Sedimentisphaerales bacterium]HRS11270.1 DUF2723 domain-containing protein [Sedimentisphaerales bacterium]HRV47848.1 DUF2723 domain-containing protein [Sedimentisphaerales bacterium]
MPKATTRIGVAYLLVLLGAGALYGVSCAPGALWQDSGLIQLRVWHHDIEGFLGLAIAHPLFHLVAIAAKHIPLGSFAHRVNLVSAFAGAVAVANLYLLVRLWVGKEFPSLVAALTLALSHTFWQHASIAETYTLWTALFLGELIVLLQYNRTGRAGYLYALGLLNGLAISVHMLALLPLVCYAVFLAAGLTRRRVRAKDIAILALLWVLGALPYEYLIVRQMIRSGQILATLASAAFGDRWRADVLNTALSWTLVRENFLLLVLNFPTPNVLLFVAGGVALYKMRSIPAFRYVLAALLVLFFVFAFRYTVSDRYAFFIPFYATASAVVGLGAHHVRDRAQHNGITVFIVAFALLPPAVYAAAPGMARRMGVEIGTRADIAYRDDYAYFLRPWKMGDNGAERFARAALEVAGPSAVIYADTTTVAPLVLVQETEGRRPDVHVVTGIVRSRGAPPYDADVFEELLACRPVYVTSERPGYAPPFVLGKYGLRKAGPLWQVVAPLHAASAEGIAWDAKHFASANLCSVAQKSEVSRLGHVDKIRKDDGTTCHHLEAVDPQHAVQPAGPCQ